MFGFFHFRLPLSLLCPISTCSLVYLWPAEWLILQQWYPSDAEISLVCTQVEAESLLVESVPSCCMECHHQRVVVQTSVASCGEDEEEEAEFGFVYIYQCEVTNSLPLITP